MRALRPAAALWLPLLIMTGPSPRLTSAGPARDNPAATAPAPPVRVDVNLVLIDVVVRDRKDQPVAGLTREEFELRVDGRAVKPEDVRSFEELCPAAAQPGPPAPPSPASPTPSPSGAAPTASAGHLVVYFDFTQTSFSARQLGLSTARRFVSGRAGSLEPTAILSFSRKELTTVQDFTTDAALLAARLDGMLKDRGTVDLDLPDDLDKVKQVHDTPMPLRREVARAFALEERQRARDSLFALKQTLDSLEGLKGRKAIALFTNVLRAEPGIQYLAQAETMPMVQGLDVNADLAALARAANLRGVSFYTVHAGGIEDGSADLIRFKDYAAMTLAPFLKVGIESAIGLQNTLAVETGGRALRNTNDPGAILGSAQRDLSCYYLLGYRFAAQGDGRRHVIEVKVRPRAESGAGRGLQVRHRPWFTDDPRVTS